jgi:hyperosmotically inducible periplasmic protein
MKRALCTRNSLSFFVLVLLFAGGLLAAPNVGAFGLQQADNTKVNKRDVDKDATTADQQKMNPSDRAMTQKIRAEIMKDKSLSTYAHNVKVITQNGKVTLKGPVRTQEEKTAVEAKATTIAGDGNVTSQIEVVPPKS